MKRLNVCVASLALASLLWTSCAPRLVTLPRHLPEPPLPECLREQTPERGARVGVLDWDPEWLASVLALSRQGRGAEATQQALGCASGAARALREALGTIRGNNNETP